MDRSLRFRVYDDELYALFRLAFAAAPPLRLNLARHRNSPVHSSIGTPSHLHVLRLLVDIRFQVLFHSPPGVLFTFPSRYYTLSVAKKYFALRVVPPASHGVSRVPRYSGSRPACSAFRLQGYYLLWRIFPDPSTRPGSLSAGPQPRSSCLNRFGLFPVRSPLLRESQLISSPGAT